MFFQFGFSFTSAAEKIAAEKIDKLHLLTRDKLTLKGYLR